MLDAKRVTSPLQWLAVWAGVWLLFGSVGASAHESRRIGKHAEEQGKYLIAVGWHQEPVYAGTTNGVVVFVTRVTDGWPISTQRGDVVDLTVEVQYRAATQEQRVLAAEALDRKPQLVPAADNQYVTWFQPALPGVYAFRVTGTIDDRSDPSAGPAEVDETFVCGVDSPGRHDRFACVELPQTFPHLDDVLAASGVVPHGAEHGHDDDSDHDHDHDSDHDHDHADGEEHDHPHGHGQKHRHDSAPRVP